MKKRGTAHHLQTLDSFQDPTPARSAFGAAVFAKTKFFQDPKKLDINRLEHKPLKDTISPTPTQAKDNGTIHSTPCTYSLVTLSSLRAHYVP